MDGLSEKVEKEAFVSGLNGTTLLEVTVVINYAFVATFLRVGLLAILPVVLTQGRWARFLLECATIVFPFVLFTTVLANDAQLLFVAFVVLATSTIILLPQRKDDRSVHHKEVNINHVKRPAARELLKGEYELTSFSDSEDEKICSGEVCLSTSMSHFITAFRAYTTIISCICILAVDFKAFPRRLAKTEVFGSGLMDTGVGFFVICNGIVSPEARGKHKDARSISSKLSRIGSAVLSSWPLWFIGAGRMASVKLLDYQEHVTEYGVHWNFFFTLAVVKIGATIILLFFNTSRCFLLSAALIGGYQVALLHPSVDLTSLILNDDRSGFFMANKEGILSCIGYLSLYFASVQAGMYLFNTDRPSVRPPSASFFKLLFLDVLLWSATVATSAHIQPISRRFANIAFVLWMLALALEFFLAYLLSDFAINYCVQHKKLPTRSFADQLLVPRKQASNQKIKYDPPAPPNCILHAVNRNMFFYFMLSNLMTGLVNKLFNTMQITDFGAVLISSAYTFFTLVPVWFLHFKQISVKFW